MGKAEELVQRLEAVRRQALAELAGAPDSALGIRPEGAPRPVRNTLLRFAEHMRQHVNQIEKTRWAVGARPTEVQLILAEAEEALGRMRAALVGLSDEELSRKPSPEAWSIAEIVEHVADVEGRFLEGARRAVGGG